MPLIPTADVVGSASRAGRGVGAFNVIQIEYAQAIVAGAKNARSPVILQISENCVRYHGALKPIAVASLAVASAAEVDVAVHLDHVESVELVHEAAALGFGSIMFDASRMDYKENVETTRVVVAFCHGQGVWVEAELGEIGGKDGIHAPGSRTDPAEAADYVEATGVDALAVAVGTSHAMMVRDAALDFELIGRLREVVPVPLVLHGSSGVSDQDLTRAVRAGMTKINISTHLNKVFTQALRDVLGQNPELVDSRRYIGAGRDVVTREVARLLGCLGEPALPPPGSPI